MLWLIKNTIKKSVFISLFFSSSLIAQTLNFNDAVTLIDENGHAEIPVDYTAVGANAFRNLAALKTLTVPSSIISIGNGAFAGTANLLQINLTSGLESIGDSAFEQSGLLGIDIPPTVTSVGPYAFAFGNLTHLTIPQSINTIGEFAFFDNPLTHLEFSMANQDGISSGAFSLACNTIETLIINSTEVGNKANEYWGSISVNQANKLDDYARSVIYVYPKLNFFFKNDDIEQVCDVKNLFLRGVESKIIHQMGIGSIENLIVESNTEPTYSHNIFDASNIFLVEDKVFPLSAIGLSSSLQVCSADDDDNDGFINCIDGYPLDTNKWQTEENTGGAGSDSDGDGILDLFDTSDNSQQCSSNTSYGADAIDTDQDGVSNYYDCDDDNDGLLDVYETGFSFNYDSSVDGLQSGLQFGTNPLNPDSDFDGALDGLDAFPMDNTESLDTDSDGIGNNADTDDDNDGYTDFLDAFPTDSSEWADSDSDGIGNNSDPDDDNDGVADTEDAFPHTASESLDSDNDGVGDNADAFPNDATEVADTDLDGIGNNADPDDDNDGVADADDGDPLNADIGIQPSQLISVAGNPLGVNGHSTRISLSYDTSDGNNQLPGIGFRVHFNSEMLTYNQDPNNCMNGYDGDDHDEGHEDDHGAGDFHGFCGSEYGYEEDEEHGHEEEHESEEHNLLHYVYNSLIVNGDGPYQDDSDFDNDTSTDKYIIFGWAALGGDFPNVTLPTALLDVVFDVNWEAFDQASITTPINFSKVSTTEGYNFEATNYTLNVLPATWDFDGNGQADALTDGLILLRHAFGVRGASLTDSVMATDSTMTSDEVQVAVEKALVIADVDGDGNVDALTDGLIVLRYMFGLTGETLMDGVVSANATRASSESVQEHIELYMPNNLLPPVQSEQSFIVGDWKLASIPEERDYELGVLGEWSTLSVWGGYTQSIFDTCVADDIYRFGDNGTFEYLISGSTYMHDEINPLWNYDNPNSYCTEPFAPWNESEIYTYNIDENNSLLTVIGRGAYIALAHVANGTNDIENAADAPESITYDFTKLSDTEVLLEIDAYDDLYRFTLEKVVN
jgi:hypothetical protein